MRGKLIGGGWEHGEALMRSFLDCVSVAPQRVILAE